MSTKILHRSSRPAAAPECAPADRVTRSLLGYGMVAGPLYVTTSLVQIALHDGFDPTRHAWSLLAAGPYGWVQSVNLALTGALVVAFAIGLARSAASRWAPRLVGAFGLGMFGAGLMTADPMHGYPVGVPAPDSPTWHGIGHMVSGSLGFLAMVVGAIVLGRMYARQGRTGFAWWCRLTGLSLGAAIVGISSGAAHPVLVLGFVTAVVATFALLVGVARDRYRSL
jgi:hypothetical protein